MKTLEQWKAWQVERLWLRAAELTWHLAMCLGMMRWCVWAAHRPTVEDQYEQLAWVALAGMALEHACLHRLGPWGLLKRWEEALQERAYRLEQER